MFLKPRAQEKLKNLFKKLFDKKQLPRAAL